MPDCRHSGSCRARRFHGLVTTATRAGRKVALSPGPNQCKPPLEDLTMTNHSSNTTTLNRRKMFSMSATLAVASVSPALAFPALGQDAELIELGRQLETVSSQWWKSGELITHLAEVAENQYPPLPDVLKARPTDKLFGLPNPMTESGTSRPRAATERNRAITSRANLMT